MKAWSSVHFITNRFNAVFNLCTAQSKNGILEQREISTYFDKCYNLRGKNLSDFPAHENDLYFMALFEKMYPKWVPGWVIEKDFKRMSLHLNIYGDIVHSTDIVSVFSPRYFGGFKRDGLMFHNMIDLSRAMKCPVVNHTYILSEKEACCKIYFSYDGKIGGAFRSTNRTMNWQENIEVLIEMFPHCNRELSGLLRINNPQLFSDLFCESLGVIAGGPQYALNLLDKAEFVKTQRLFDIYRAHAG